MCDIDNIINPEPAKTTYNPNYYANFKSKNADKIKEKKVCEICGGKYDYFNKSKHNQGLKHKYKLLLIEKEAKIDEIKQYL
jgi:hypothetical protein